MLELLTAAELAAHVLARDALLERAGRIADELHPYQHAEAGR